MKDERPVNAVSETPAAPEKKRRAGSLKNLLQIFFDTFLVRNIVLVKMIGLCPILAVAVNLKYGVALTLCAGVALIPAALLMSLVGEKLKPAARAPLYTLLASLLLLGAAYVADLFAPELYAALYLYLPLMAVNTLVTYRAGGFAVTSRPLAAMSDALGSTLGFGIVICIVSVAREFLTYGTLWELPLMDTPLLPAAGSPFMAFLILAVLAAGLQFVRALLRRFVEGEVSTDV